MTSSNSTSITASWELPAENARHGIITGFKLFYKKEGSAGKPITLTITNGASRYKALTGLAKYTKYEFQLLAFTSVGDGPKSSIRVAKTNEDGKKSKIIIEHFSAECRKLSGIALFCFTTLCDWFRKLNNNVR